MNKKLYSQGKINIPDYIKDIVQNVRWVGLYEYKLIGTNKSRPSYGIHADIEKLKKWAERHGAEFIIKHVNEKTNNYYIIFEMSDPVSQAFEKAGLFK